MEGRGRGSAGDPEGMMHAADLSVPLEIDMHSGKNWYEAK